MRHIKIKWLDILSLENSDVIKSCNCIENYKNSLLQFCTILHIYVRKPPLQCTHNLRILSCILIMLKIVNIDWIYLYKWKRKCLEYVLDLNIRKRQIPSATNYFMWLYMKKWLWHWNPEQMKFIKKITHFFSMLY